MRNTLLIFAGLLLAPRAQLSIADPKPNVLLLLSEDHSHRCGTHNRLSRS